MTAKKLQRRRADSAVDPAAEVLPVDYASLLADVKELVRSARYLALRAGGKRKTPTTGWRNRVEPQSGHHVPLPPAA
jgi:hypothetical protein